MAKLNNNHFGNLSGQIGNLIYRTINGITYVSTKPEKVKISYSAKAVAGRRKFGLVALLSGAMNRVFLINAIWKKAKLPQE